MSFAQLTYRESLRDIETCLRALGLKLYHAGIRGRVSRSTLADANENRDWRIYADFAQVLINTAKDLYAGEEFGVDLEATVYALDSTTIDLCLSLFPWARFRRTKGAIKLHTLLNLRGNIPELIYISDGKLHDVNVLDILIPEPGSYYLMDRGYIDFERLYSIHQATAFFVTRAKRNFQFKRRYSRSIDGATGLQCDQTIILTGVKPATAYRSSIVQSEVAGRVVLQMDQTTPADKSILRHFRKCCKNANLDRYISLCTGCDLEKTAWIKHNRINNYNNTE